jgi:hypothetical protein
MRVLTLLLFVLMTLSEVWAQDLVKAIPTNTSVCAFSSIAINPR